MILYWEVSVSVKLLSCVQLFVTPWTIQSMKFSSQNTWVGISLLQGVFSTQGSNPSLSHCRQILYQLSHQGSPRILEWVADPFSSGSSQPRNQTKVTCIAGGFFSNWATREAPWYRCLKFPCPRYFTPYFLCQIWRSLGYRSSENFLIVIKLKIFINLIKIWVWDKPNSAMTGNISNSQSNQAWLLILIFI